MQIFLMNAIDELNSINNISSQLRSEYNSKKSSEPETVVEDKASEEVFSEDKNIDIPVFSTNEEPGLNEPSSDFVFPDSEEFTFDDSSSFVTGSDSDSDLPLQSESDVVKKSELSNSVSLQPISVSDVTTKDSGFATGFFLTLVILFLFMFFRKLFK